MIINRFKHHGIVKLSVKQKIAKFELDVARRHMYADL